MRYGDVMYVFLSVTCDTLDYHTFPFFSTLSNGLKGWSCVTHTQSTVHHASMFCAWWWWGCWRGVCVRDGFWVLEEGKRGSWASESLSVKK